MAASSKKKTPATSKKPALKKTSKHKSSSSLKMDWPKSTEVLFRPDRYHYVKAEKNTKAHQCVFCYTASERPSFDSLCLFKNKLAQIVMNKYPYNAGHLLVLPLRHEGDFLALSEPEVAEIYRLKRKAIAALKNEYSPLGFNLGANLGVAAGAGIPEHLHFHVIPRWHGDTNFFPLIAKTKVIIEDLEKTYSRLKKYFEEAKS